MDQYWLTRSPNRTRHWAGGVYTFTDPDPLVGDSFFLLNNTDFIYSDQVSITISGPKETATVMLSNVEQFYDGKPKEVEVETNPEGLNVLITYNGSATPPTAPGEYAVEAVVVDKEYEGMATDILRISVPTSVAAAKESQLLLYPTPTATGQVTVEGLQESQPVQVLLTDALGREVLEAQLNVDANGSLQLDLGKDLTSGIYFLQLQQQQKIQLLRVLLQ